MTYRWCYYEVTLLGDPELAWQYPARPDPTDRDGDGMPDALEEIAGTDPAQSSSVLRVRVLRGEPSSGVRLEWPSVAGRTYSVWAARGASDREFERLAAGLEATPPANAFVESPPAGSSSFYLISVQLAPQSAAERCTCQDAPSAGRRKPIIP
jgi:hypothetical protein